MGANINGKGVSTSAGRNYEERAVYDINERVSNSSTKMSGIGVVGLDAFNTQVFLAKPSRFP